MTGANSPKSRVIGRAHNHHSALLRSGGVTTFSIYNRVERIMIHCRRKDQDMNETSHLNDGDVQIGLAPAIVVGIDGSHRAIAAALWAVDEAVGRDIPLRLVYVVEPRNEADQVLYAAHDLATGEIATQSAIMAVQSTDQPVKIEVEIAQGSPADALIRQSCAAAMVCVGALSAHRASDRRASSTLAPLSARAHCPVTIVRQHRPANSRHGSVLIEFEDTPDCDDLLESGFQTAQLRGIDVRIFAGWTNKFALGDRSYSAAETAAMTHARLERKLAPWRLRYPDVEASTVAVPGTVVEYLSQHGDSIQIAVVGRRRRGGVGEFIYPSAGVASNLGGFATMVCGRGRSL